MTSDATAPQHELNPASERFYAGAIRRITRALIVFSLILIVPVGYKFGIPSLNRFRGWGCCLLAKLSLPGAWRGRSRRPHRERPVAGKWGRCHYALSPSLSVGWRDRLCYICWLSFGVSGIPVRTLPACSSHAHRGCVRSACGIAPRVLSPQHSPLGSDCMEQLVFTEFLNHHFAVPVMALFRMLGIKSAHPSAPISNEFAMELLVVFFLTIFFLLVRARLSVDRPGGLQHVVEGIEGFVGSIGNEIIGHGYEKYVPYLVALGLFILACNLIGLVPGLESPTAIPVVPLGCALITWFYYHFQGLRTNGMRLLQALHGTCLVARAAHVSRSKSSATWLACCL